MALSASFGFASLLAATVNLFHPELIMSAWQLLLVLYAMCLLVLVICKYANAFLPLVDTICAALNVLCVLAILVALSATAKAGRRSAADTLGYYDKTLSGWGDFSFFIGMLPPAYTFAVVGMMCSMAEECDRAAVKVPAAMSLCIPIAGLAGFLFILPICVTMPPLEDILRAPFGQVMPYIFHQVTGSTACALALLLLILILLASAIVGVTVVASRYTWAFSRDKALPGAAIWSQIHPRLGVPTNALYLITAVQMILGLISLGNTTAFNAFVSMSVIALSLSYGLPIAISMWCGRKAVSEAQWRMPNILGWTVNAISILWITFECFLFSMPVTKALPHPDQMNYASVVLVGMGVLVAAWYVIHARKGMSVAGSMDRALANIFSVFKGPSISL